MCVGGDHFAKSIKEHHDENPAYYDNFSEKIRKTLELYKEQVISESEYLMKMREIMEEYRKGSINTFPRSFHRKFAEEYGKAG